MIRSLQPTLEDASPSSGGQTILFGGSGFLGSHILQRHPHIVSVGRTPPSTPNPHISVHNLADLGALRAVPFDKVIYVIGSSDRPNMEKDQIPLGEPTPFDYHALPLLQTLEQLKRYPIKKLIHFSTVLLYDEKVVPPVSEQAPINPYKNRYVFSMHLGEEACRFYSRWIPIINVRLSNLYGPTARPRFDLIHGLVRQLLTQGQGQVRSTRPARDWLYVEDAVDAITKLLETDYTGTLNLGSGVMTSVRQVVDILEAVSGGLIVDLDQPVDGPLRFQCDMSALESLIDWKPKYSLEEGIRRTYELMKSWR